jgi:hypothetical protein
MPRKFAIRPLRAERVDEPSPRILLLLCAGAERVRKSLQKRAQLDCAGSVSGAKELWKPGRYDIVLAAFDRDPKASARLCDEIKKQSPNQLLIFLVGSGEDLPPEPCPDAVFPKEEPPEYLIARIETFLAARNYRPRISARPPAFAPHA